MATIRTSAKSVGLPGRAAGRITVVPGFTEIASWRLRGMGMLRIVFGLIWAVDAAFKWQPGFLSGMPEYLSGSLEGQPAAVQGWINFWLHVVHIDPLLFAYAVAVGETTIALGLIFGVLTNLASIAGLFLSVGIWTTAEGFGGPYTPGSADIGAAVIYVLVFAALILTGAGLYYGLDRRITPLLGKWSFLAAGPLRAQQSP